MGEDTGHVPNAPRHAALFERLGDISRYAPLVGALDRDGYPILDGVYVGQTVEAVKFGQAHPEWGSFRPAVLCRALIDTGAQGCTITRTLVDQLDLKPVPGTDAVRVKQRMVDGSSGGYEIAYPAGITIGGAFYVQVNAPAILVPDRNDKDEDRYEILIGCDVLKRCVLVYDGQVGKEFTLYVPRNISPVILFTVLRTWQTPTARSFLGYGVRRRCNRIRAVANGVNDLETIRPPESRCSSQVRLP